RLLIFALGSTSSGIPREWAATETRPGVNLLENLSEKAAHEVVREVYKIKRPGDVAVVSIHWGDNCGYDVSSTQTEFAHRLIDGGVDLIYGHSSHHPKAIEVYRDRLILYGCGDFLTDYEGISGYEDYRSDLGLMYLVRLDPEKGCLLGLEMIPLRS